MKRRLILVALFGAALMAGASGAMAASSILKAADGTQVGTVDIAESPNGVLLRAVLTGLPEGEHGFHIHQIGKCTPDFGAAGGHLAGAATKHGFDVEGGPHAGDMPDLIVPSSGELTVEVFVPGVSFHGGKAPLFDDDGSAIVIHADPDDNTSQPSGNAGQRIACGVIEE
jgi:superoxide dismutase, Cu-Zn family